MRVIEYPLELIGFCVVACIWSIAIGSAVYAIPYGILNLLGFSPLFAIPAFCIGLVCFIAWCKAGCP